MSKSRVALVLAVALMGPLAGCAGENHYEQLADRVTKAIVANDMRPVERDFNALRRPQLENRARVGQLSDLTNSMGSFKRTHEDTAKNAQPGYHHFTANFAKGMLVEDMTLDADGKIAAFHVHTL